MDWKENLHLADYVMTPLRGLIEKTLKRSLDVENIEEIYTRLTKKEAQRRVARLEEHCKTYEERLDAFLWAPDPPRALMALYRRAGKDPRSR